MLRIGIGTSTLRHTLCRFAPRGAQAALLFLASYAFIAPGVSPFMTAMLAAGLFSGWDAPCMAAGCLLSIAAACARSGAEIWRALDVALALGLWYALARTSLPARLKLPVNEDGSLRAPDAAAALIAGLSALPGALIAAQDARAIALALGGGLIALALAPVLTSAMRLRAHRTRLTPDERLALALAALICLLGARRGLPGFPAPCMACYFTLVAAWTGAAPGAAVGLTAGALLIATGDAPVAAVLLGLAGMLAGAANRMGRIWMALGFLAVGTGAMALGIGMTSPAWLTGVAVAAALWGLTPAKAFNKACEWSASPRAMPDIQHLFDLCRAHTEKRLRALGAAFDELAAGCDELDGEPDEQALLCQMRARLCGGCARYGDCWGGNNEKASQMLRDLFASTLRGEPLSQSDELPPDLGRVCMRAGDMPRKLGPLMAEFVQKRRVARESRNAQMMLTRHFGQARDILLATADACAAPVAVDGALTELAEASLERAGFELAHAVCLAGEGAQVSATLRRGKWSERDARRAALCLSAALGVPMRAATDSGSADGAMRRFVQAPRLTATVGCFCQPGKPGAPNGDCHLAAGLTGARVLLALSDGMGSGEKAARESAAAIRMARRFLLAGVRGDLTLEAINRLLRLRGNDETFATADLCVLDLQNGEGSFLKQGACPSYVLRHGKCLRVEGGMLPLGILDKVKPGQSSMALRPGDTVVLFTDGIADCASDEDAQWIESELKALCRETPSQLCAALIKRAQSRVRPRCDDMTVLAAHIERAG